MTKNEIAELKELKAMLAGMTDAIVALTALVAELKATPAPAPAASRVIARKQPADNVWERAKLAINEARGYEPHAFVPRDMLEAKVKELQA